MDEYSFILRVEHKLGRYEEFIEKYIYFISQNVILEPEIHELYSSSVEKHSLFFTETIKLIAQDKRKRKGETPYIHQEFFDLEKKKLVKFFNYIKENTGEILIPLTKDKELTVRYYSTLNNLYIFTYPHFLKEDRIYLKAEMSHSINETLQMAKAVYKPFEVGYIEAAIIYSIYHYKIMNDIDEGLKTLSQTLNNALRGLNNRQPDHKKAFRLIQIMRDSLCAWIYNSSQKDDYHE